MMHVFLLLLSDIIAKYAYVDLCMLRSLYMGLKQLL